MRPLVAFERPASGGPTAQRRARVCILGCTGSIGVSGLEVVRRYPEHLETTVLAAGGNVELLVRQIAEFKPAYAAVKDAESLERLRQLLEAERIESPRLCAGEAEIAALAALPEVDVVLAAIVGFAGLRAVLAAAAAGKRIALANKESLVAGGALVQRAAEQGGAAIVPVDSEHSALFQLMQGQELQAIERLILTASGGPFLKLPAAELEKIKPDEALRHPKWRMGPKISVDSATMVNKALEVIEAHWLFGVEVERIDVLVHPQSIVHSLIALADGSQLAQLSVPDMKGPIAHGLMYPAARLPGVMRGLRLAEVGSLDFLPLDPEQFPAVDLARAALRAGGAAAAVFNIANEVAVEAFLKGCLRFDRIVPFAARALEQYGGLAYGSYEELAAIDADVRQELREACI